jgi:hypothetical protein
MAFSLEQVEAAFAVAKCDHTSVMGTFVRNLTITYTFGGSALVISGFSDEVSESVCQWMKY